MIASRCAITVFLVLGISSAGARAQAQEGKSQDEALDNLLEKLAAPDGASAKSAKAAKPAEKAKTEKRENNRSGAAASGRDGGRPSSGQPAKGSTGQAAKPKAPKPPGSGDVAPKDKALDDLLEKLGQSSDKPTPEEHPQGAGPGQARKESPPSGKTSPAKLGGKDKEIDESLEELAGRKRKRRQADEERTGPVGEIIKEMRDVEQRLGKPDPGEDTQNKEKQIIKRIDTLIEEARKSGSSGSRLVLRRVRRPGQRQGQQPGDQQGAMAQGAPPMKPAKPSTSHSTAGGREVWGHLPAELRQLMDNTFKETDLNSKAEMISRYFTSISKGKLVREQQ